MVRFCRGASAASPQPLSPGTPSLPQTLRGGPGGPPLEIHRVLAWRSERTGSYQVPPDLQPPLPAVAAGAGVPAAAARLIVNVLVLARVRGHGERAGRADAVTETGRHRAEVEAGRAERRRRVALRVVLRVCEARLDLRDEVTSVRLRRGVLALLLLTEERRESDRGKNADDQDDDQELDERKALIVLAHVAQHVILRLDRLESPAPLSTSVATRLPRVPRPVALRPALTNGVPLASEGDWHLLTGGLSTDGVQT